ncbi:MAG: ABC transporter ATP-binding protein [Rickettsiales bacterium]|jgi:lipoprotein-releasing system ATP-binding protein|nr:ABC transporter ATP-binding protein [Rickettsiales bacterium]
MAASPIVLGVKDVSKIYREGRTTTATVFDGASFSIEKGEMVALVGLSGSGKTTMLQLCGLLDRVDEGDIEINGVSTRRLSEEERTEIRKSSIGFVYQMHHLFSEFSAVENVMLPLLVKGYSGKAARERAVVMLEQLGLSDRKANMPSELSGGERQRVAIARALVAEPNIVLADEPTGNLDEANSNRALSLLMNTLKKLNASLLIVTHNMDLAERMDRTMTIREHKILDIGTY